MNCTKCKIALLGHRAACPLCGSRLTGGFVGDSAFPEVVPAPQPSRFALYLTVFITIFAAVACVGINAVTTPDKWWSLFVIGGLCSLWISVGMAFYKRRNILKMMTWQAVIIMLLALAWDLFTGFHKWSLDFVLPIGCICTLLAMTVFARVMNLDARDYVVYLIIASVLGCCALILLLCGVLTVRLPSVICLATSTLFLSALFLFQRKTLLSELNRRMHI